MADLMPLWQTLAGGSITLIATVVTQAAIGRRDREARGIARSNELADLKEEREHARQTQVRGQARAAAESVLALALGLRERWRRNWGGEPWDTDATAKILELQTSALLLDDGDLRSTVARARNAMYDTNTIAQVDALSDDQRKALQLSILVALVEVMAAYLRDDVDEVARQRIEINEAWRRGRAAEATFWERPLPGPDEDS